jgi:hypothetical protein
VFLNVSTNIDNSFDIAKNKTKKNPQFSSGTLCVNQPVGRNTKTGTLDN